MIKSLKHKPNLYDIDDMEIEEFRDLISDLTSYKEFLKLGYVGHFGNGCALETVSHNQYHWMILMMNFLNIYLVIMKMR